MSQILERVRDVDANNSEAVKEALSSFFQHLSKYKDVDCNRWLHALENIINRFPKFCGTHRPTIETYIAHFLTSNNYYNVIEAAKCAHALQQVRPSQDRTSTPKSNWRDQMISLCDSAHKLIDAIFTKNVGLYLKNQNNQNQTDQSSQSSLQECLSSIERVADSGSAVNKTTILCTRLRNVLVFIQAMLVEIYPVPKPIQPQLILAVILQALSGPGSEDSPNVTTIKIQALRTLDALVACLGPNLIPFSSLVFRFVMQTFKWSSEYPSEDTRKVRIAAYNSLSTWLDSLHVYRPTNDASTRAWHIELTAHIIDDGTPVEKVMSLKTNNPPSMKNLSKKARKRVANSMLLDSKIGTLETERVNKNKLSEKSNDEVAVAALECAETFLSVCGIFLTTAAHKQIQEMLVRECFELSEHSSPRAAALLRALEASRKSCPLKVPPPTQYCLHLYSKLVNSNNREISRFCSQALLDIRLHLHCSPQSLNYSSDTQTEKEKEEGRKRVTERNRAVLEKLIGIDWMNPEDPTDEVISIPDEPMNKRPRLENQEEISENISLSSDSVHSVEMTSDSNDDSIIEDVELILGNDDSIVGAEEIIIAPMASLEVNGRDISVYDQPTQAPIRENVEVDEPRTDKATETSKDDAEVQEIMESETPGTQNIHEAITQKTPATDTIDGHSPKSQVEVSYDYPNTGTGKVTVLEKIDDENLPSTNETDDIQITCGQVVKDSQDGVVDVDKTKDSEEEIQKVNGFDEPVENGKAIDEEASSKIAPKDAAVTVEDMLADFVDEVNEDQT